jgi:hypothetical protein
MSAPRPLFRRIWLLVPICALGFLAWTNSYRVQDVERLSDSPDWSGDPLKLDDASPTGYAGGMRRLVVPGHDNYAYQRIEQTQQMFAKRQIRVRRVDYENAPFGREVIAPSPYRWWLGLVSVCDSALSGRSIGLSVEHAALYADPVLAALLLLASTILVARWFGGFSAAVFSTGFVALFPFGGAFLPGEPDDHTVMLGCALGSVLPLLAGIRAATKGEARRRFVIAGIAAGIGLWTSVTGELFTLAGIVLGAVAAAWIARGDPDRLSGAPVRPYVQLPWRAWGLSGAATALVAYLIDYFPARIGPGLEVVNPLLALALGGLGEVLAFVAAWIAPYPATESAAARGMAPADRAGPAAPRKFIVPGAAAALIAAVVLAIALRPHRMVFDMDPVATRLTNLHGAGVVADSFAAWVTRDGFSGPAAAACLPLLICLPALAFLVLGRVERPFRALLSIALGVVAVALAVACAKIHGWNALDGALLALLAASVSGVGGMPSMRTVRWLIAALAAFAFVPGLLLLLPEHPADGRQSLSAVDLQGLIERDLAHWIGTHADSPGAVVLASPNLTVSLCYHGGLAGLGTLNWENLDGIKGSIRIASATEPEEALDLIRGRNVGYIIVPSWDMFLDKFAGTGLGVAPDSGVGIQRSFVGGMLAQIQLPNWIELVPYRIPSELGDRWVMIFKVVDKQDPATALSRTAEYFVEMGYLDRAGAMAQRLRRYPASLAALAARAQVEKARNDDQAFAAVFKTLLFFVSRGDDRSLPFDRRMSLAIALVQGGRADLARDQVERCLEQIDEARLRSLSTVSLFYLQRLGRAFDLRIVDPRLRALAIKLLPPDLRSQI